MTLFRGTTTPHTRHMNRQFWMLIRPLGSGKMIFIAIFIQDSIFNLSLPFFQPSGSCIFALLLCFFLSLSDHDCSCYT